MTTEKLAKGKLLIEKLDKLRREKDIWEEASGINRLQLINYGRTPVVDESILNFEDIKLLAIARLTKAIEQTQQEFDEL